MDILQLNDRLALAMRHRSWEAFSALVHPEVEFLTTFDPQREFAGPDGLREWWDDMAGSLVYQASVSEIAPLSERAAFVEGRIQASMDSGMMRDMPASWVIVAKDGLAWRCRPVQSRSEALAYAQVVGAVDRDVLEEG
jgi:SnoaL-like protein